MNAGGGMGITPIRHIYRPIDEEHPGRTYCKECQKFQSFVLLVVCNTAAMKKTVLTPAPTDASVNATSTEPISAQSRHIKKLYTPKMMAELKRSFTVIEATAQITTKTRSIRSSCQITLFPPHLDIYYGFSILGPRLDLGIKCRPQQGMGGCGTGEEHENGD